jgi:probable F420-dependent oxidoreductase|tara:strand:+ start:1238 stop:2287 length:1050 start_codon:yes stop_codon:yes gene_type:complete
MFNEDIEEVIMKFDVAVPAAALKEIPDLARRAEELGAAGLWSSETQRHPFLSLPLVAEHTTRLEFGTAVAIGFGRSPLTLAHTAWDLAEQSDGRFIMGLGTQVKAHIERRFSQPWPESPVGKLREQIAAMRAIWHSWQTGERLNYRGEYYQHTLMTPFFSPPPIDHPQIPIYIAGVNAGLARLAGEAADGFHIHPLHSLRYLREVVLQNLEAGTARAGRSPNKITRIAPAMVAIGADEKSRTKMRDLMRAQIAFYASTPTYRVIMQMHGWEEIAAQLSHMAARKRWNAMPGLISGEMLAEFVTEGSWEDIGHKLRARYSGLLDRVTLYTPLTTGENLGDWKKIARAIQE